MGSIAPPKLQIPQRSNNAARPEPYAIWRIKAESKMKCDAVWLAPRRLVRKPSGLSRAGEKGRSRSGQKKSKPGPPQMTKDQPESGRSEKCKCQEVQRHGFVWERDILEKVFGLTVSEINSIKYGNQVDLPRKLNRIYDCDISIKTTGRRNTVCMADCLRVFDLCAGRLHLIVVIYNQSGPVKRFSEVVELDLSNSRELLFGRLKRTDIEALVKLVKSVPTKRAPTQQEKHAMRKLRDELRPRCGALMLNIKCDSTQSRVQCSFNQFIAFLHDNPDRVVERNKVPRLHDREFIGEVASGRRVFRKKA